MTSSTEESRSARSAPRGTSNGTRASASDRFARTIRWAIVASGTRKARAISPVVSPPTRRRVSATRASVERIGWQEMNTSRSRSSPMSSSSAASRAGTVISCRDSSSRPSSWCLRSASDLLRNRSIARRFAVAMSQAPGLSGTPASGHRSSATTSASWASSSARPTSRTIRVRAAIKRADSILQTASIARWVSEAVTASDHTIFNPSVEDRAKPRLLLLTRHLRPNALLLRPELRSEFRAEIVRLEHLPDLELRLAAREGIRGAFDPFDRLFSRFRLDQPEAGDQLLGLGAWSVDHRPLRSREPDARSLRARVEAFPGQQHAGLRQLFVVPAHLGEKFLARHDARLGVLVGLDDHHESHLSSPFPFEFLFRPAPADHARSSLHPHDERPRAGSTASRKVSGGA